MPKPTEKQKLLPAVIVVNNEPRVMQYQLAHGEKAVTLQPGANEVRGQDWARMLELASVKQQLKTVSENPELPHGQMMLVLVEGLPALNELGADQLLRSTYDKGLIAAWLEREERDEIRALMQRRLTEIDRIAEQAAKHEARQKKQQAGAPAGA